MMSINNAEITKAENGKDHVNNVIKMAKASFDTVDFLVGSIFALFFALLLTFGGEYNYIEQFMLSILAGVISLYLCHFCRIGIEVKRIINDFDERMKSDLERSFVNVMSGSLPSIISTFISSHDKIIKEIYDNYPSRYVDKIGEIIDNISEKTCSRGFTIWSNKCDVNDYSDVVTKIASMTSESIYCTTYYDVEEFVKEITNSDSKVVKWFQAIAEVSTKESIKGSCIEVKRIQIFENVDDYNSFIEKVKHDDDLKEAYCRLMAPSWIDLKGYIIPSKNQDVSNMPDFYGEYIIFDKKATIMWDSVFKHIMILCGKISNDISLPFTEDYSQGRRMDGRLFKDIRGDLGC